MTDAEVLDVARRFFDAIERADIDAVAALYADDVAIHHLAEGTVSIKARNLARLKHSTATWRGRRYVDRDLRVAERGFVQRHVLEREQDDRILRAPACIVCDVADGRITALYEYFDIAQMIAWRDLREPSCCS